MSTPFDVDRLANTNRRRSRQGCLICRRRKIKCDEQSRPCNNCSRLGLQCVWGHDQSKKQRSRTNKACSTCRTRKQKCIPSNQPNTCLTCLEEGRECTGDSSISSPSQSQVIRSMDSTSNQESSISTMHLNQETLRQLLDAFFKGPYHFCFYSFIHAPMFMKMFDNDHVPEPLLLIIAATTLKVLDPWDPRPDHWADECRRKTMLDAFLPPTQMTLQTFLLLQRYEWHRNSHISAWITSAIAVRLTHALQLNLELSEKDRKTDAISITICEIRRRTMWGCFIMESLMEGGRNPFSGLDLKSITVKLPCDEHSFQLGIEQRWTESPENQTTFTAATSRLPALEGRPDVPAYLVRLAVLRMLILQYSAPYHPSNLYHMPKKAPWELEEPFHQFEAELISWSNDFEEDLQFSTDNLYRRQPHIIGFITFHCMFHGCFCDLYRIGSYITTSIVSSDNPQFLGAPESFLQRCRDGRLEHAIAIAKTIDTGVKYLRNTEHDPFIAISACLAIRILTIERRLGDFPISAISDAEIFTLLQPAFQCAKRTAQWSLAVEKLLLAVCKHASRCGFDFEISDLQRPNTPSRPSSRPASPSLRTYGTLGSIQSSLAKRHDVWTPAVTHQDPEQSDIFVTPTVAQTHSSTTSPNNNPHEFSVATTGTDTEHLSPNNRITESGAFEWDSGSLGLLNDPFPLGWADHSLGFDPDHDWISALL